MRYWTDLFNYYFWEYMFRRADNPRWTSKNMLIDWWNRFKCRYNNHPCGIIYYTDCTKTEPDDRCKDCGDYI